MVDFRPLYTVAIHDLQRQLTREIRQIQTQDVTDEQLGRIRDTLHKYSESPVALLSRFLRRIIRDKVQHRPSHVTNHSQPTPSATSSSSTPIDGRHTSSRTSQRPDSTMALDPSSKGP